MTELFELLERSKSERKLICSVEHTNVRMAFGPPCGANWGPPDYMIFSSLIGLLLHPDDFIGCPTDLFKFPVCPVAVNFIFIFNSLEKSLQFLTV